MHRIITSAIFLYILTFASCCPDPESLYPCTCGGFELNRIITCPRLRDNKALMKVVRTLKELKTFHMLIIEGGYFMNIPHYIFKGMKFQIFNLIDSTFMSLTDTDIAFEGLEDDLNILYLRDCVMMNDWDWSVLRNLRRLSRISIDVDLEYLSEDITELNAPNLSFIDFANNKISYIYDKALAKFNRVIVIFLQNNLISEIKRSMLPDSADLLGNLYLSNNRIRELPPDMFDNMPNLKIVDLSSNLLITLNGRVFSKVWSNLVSLNLTGNLLRCDCRLAWMLELEHPQNIYGICDKPPNLKGKNLVQLKHMDLVC